GQYLSGGEAQVVFATGSGVEAGVVEVTWRDGSVSRVEGVQPNHIYEIAQGAAGAQPTQDATTLPATQDPSEATLFVSAPLDHVHAEAPYDDFARQPLLPWRTSQQGPGLAFTDLNGDERPDLVIGSGREGSVAPFVNQGGPLRRLAVTEGVPATTFDLAGVATLPTPTGPVVLVARTNYERLPQDEPQPSRLLQYRYGTERGGVLRQVATTEVGMASIGALALGDADGDADLDVFVAGRHLPGLYPQQAPSYWLRNDGVAQDGSVQLEVDAALSAPFAELGLTTSALIFDINGDGRQDLITTEEWGRVRLFEGSDRGFLEATTSWGLDGLQGWWNGVNALDVDADGDADLVVTNWGWNTKYGRPEETGHPLRLYWGDYDGNGAMDMVEARYEPSYQGYVPERGLSYMAYAIPLVRRRIRAHQQYAQMTVDQILPGIEDGNRHEANTLGSVLLVNEGGRFTATPLPAWAQMAPAFAPVVADFDGDGHDDVFLSQNMFALPVEVPRLDGGRGLLLRGDGTGTLSPVRGQDSGLAIYGEQRGAAAADVDGDGRVDLAVSQNGAATTLWRNQGARPGVRVTLQGPATNPAGVGSQVRIAYADGSFGPTRWVLAGSGYWSQSELAPTLGLDPARTAEAVEVRWPDGTVATVALEAGAPTVQVGYVKGS
ncbi:MAG: FG-GAP-like repeat-containing protein, partial [Bacteroidota bacterium]